MKGKKQKGSETLVFQRFQSLFLLPATGIELPNASKNSVRKGVLRSLQLVVTTL